MVSKDNVVSLSTALTIAIVLSVVLNTRSPTSTVSENSFTESTSLLDVVAVADPTSTTSANLSFVIVYVAVAGLFVVRCPVYIKIEYTNF